MKNLFFAKSLLSPSHCGWLLLLGASTAWAAPSDPEDSPLYASSRVKAFATMDQCDRGGLSPDATGAAARPGAVIVVEGRHWYKSSASEFAGSGKQLNGSGPSPSDLTYAVTCVPPTSCATCSGTTRCGSGATCTALTCAGPTCFVSPPTCYYAATCYGPMGCSTELVDVNVPQPGQFQVSFGSSAQLKYVLQYSTNLSNGSWTEACTTNGTGSTITLRHTNSAPLAVYRLLIQTLSND